ncbi:N-lysine methyltransferase KMT5A-A-like [Mizuhopecten yessoensis]|uniref:N-lysine methyltransferase KMT5A-A-like n=1 Tax=Mizuhopecten yessoensis TaxID=6573 RepID=UPI000B458F29|nr:N-lysine methyltransferase KMT5A-A-like [Mizuhopecten yessoensis]
MSSRKKRKVEHLVIPKRNARITPEKTAQIWIERQEDQEEFKIIYVNAVKGYGVFATKEFKKGDFLLEYVGETIDEEEAVARENKYAMRQKNAKYPRCYTFYHKHNGRHFCIDATNTTGRAGSLVNDGILMKHFNCKIRKIIINGKVHLALFATRQITRGSEILYDYGEDDLWWRKSCGNDVNLETSGKGFDALLFMH